ncbi:MAG TPA: MFS transporter [Candidatus Limnocylindrales bacterium]|nr:MFS transporter [Candidatus Limnocylindrales bacterium]
MDRLPLVVRTSASGACGRAGCHTQAPAPLSRDFRLLLLARLVRAFAFGYAVILVPLQLERRGLSPTQIGLSLAVGILGAGIGSVGWARASSRIGRRRALASIGVLMALTGWDLALSPTAPLLMLAGITGMMGTAAVDLAPFAAIEQAVLAEAVHAARRNLAFSRYAMTAGLAGAAGGLSAALAATPQRSDAFFIAYAGIGLTTAVLGLLLSDQVEGHREAAARRHRLPRAVYTLAGLFAIDAFGGGFVVNSVIAYWLHLRFHASLGVLGPTFGVLALAQALSYEMAGRLANRIGLIRTMVITHLPSNVLLLLVPLAPTLPTALVLLVLRFSLSQMDVPTRQAYVVSIVPPPDRADAAALMTAARGLTAAAGPAISGAALQSAAFGLPFFLAGGVKILYDLAVYLGFRQRWAAHERRGE